jgi:hypothetical protein
MNSPWVGESSAIKYELESIAYICRKLTRYIADNLEEYIVPPLNNTHLTCNKGANMLHITYHALSRLSTRTSLTVDHAHIAINHGLDLDAMPQPIRSYINNRLGRYDKALYRLYDNVILVYRPNTYKDTKATRPYALITVLPLPTYLRLQS